METAVFYWAFGPTHLASKSITTTASTAIRSMMPIARLWGALHEPGFQSWVGMEAQRPVDPGAWFVPETVIP
jgi:hypothetical protein